MEVFPITIDPSDPENLSDLIKAVKLHKADIGILMEMVTDSVLLMVMVKLSTLIAISL